METVKDELSGLQAVNSSIHNQTPFEPNLDTNFIPQSTAECTIRPDGTVNCPVAIYHDRKTWRRSRHHVENEIQQLKMKLEKLKEIRRHLKHSKPVHIMDDVESNATDSTDTIGFNQVQVNLAPPSFGLPWFPVDRKDNDNLTTEGPIEEATRGVKRKRINDGDENHRSSRRGLFRPRLDVESVTTDSSNLGLSTIGFGDNYSPLITTRVPPVTNHHRHHHHHHKHHTTASSYSDVENTTSEATSSRGSLGTTNAPFVVKTSTYKVDFVYLISICG